MIGGYLEVISLIERLHRHVLELMKLKIEGLGIHDINNVQAMILSNIQDVGITVGELSLRGYYHGSNVSYNVKKLVESGYLVQERSASDRRVVLVRLTTKGSELRYKLNKGHGWNIDSLHQIGISETDLAGVVLTLGRLERFWVRARDLAPRSWALDLDQLPPEPPGAEFDHHRQPDTTGRARGAAM